MSSSEILRLCRKLVPKLSDTSHKGTCGRIGVFGGSPEFTGAPYFAGISALRAGADLVYVFCSLSAAVPIKSYSPELMVLPFLDHEDCLEECKPWLPRLHSILIGPGLGRDPFVMKNMNLLIKHLVQTPSENGRFRPLIFDADGIFFLRGNPVILKEYVGEVFLTPNLVEFNALFHVLLGHLSSAQPTESDLIEICRNLGDKVSLVVKGPKDLISNDNQVLTCYTPGSLRRCGGQGDMLSGILSTFAAWVALRRWTEYPQINPDICDNLLACFSATHLVRACSAAAFKTKGRSMLVTDMINELPEIFRAHFEKIESPKSSV